MARFALNRVLPAFGSRLLCDIDADAIREYQKKRLAEGAQGRTINIEIGVLRQVLKANECWQPLDGKVKTLYERKDVGRALTPEEEYRLLEAAHKSDSACYTAVVLALNTGMRKNEIRTLRWDQIEFAQRTLTVGHSKTAAGTGRLIPLNATAFDALARWAGRFPEAKSEQPVFPLGWRTAWRHALKLAGVRCRFHDLRHTCITKLAEGQAGEQTMMAIAGHVSRRMLEHYSHIRMDAKRTALDSLTPVFQVGVHQNVHQISASEAEAESKLLN
jgi:integrase